mgnify:CR=1 FL=1
MAAKIQIKSDSVGNFGGIFLVLDRFDNVGMSDLVDNSLGCRRFNSKYSHSDIVKTILATFASGGSCIEDSRRISEQISENSQGYRPCSPDVILNSFGELSSNPDFSRSESGIEYKFCYNPELTQLAVKGLLLCEQIDAGAKHVFDYDNQFIPAEKYDATFSYKKAMGYFPGVAQVDGLPFFVENRDGNANVKYRQAETLEKAYAALEENGVKVGQSRMDCGSYSKEIVRTVASHSERFYIRARGCDTLRKRILEMEETEWESVEINHIKCQLASIPFTAFMEEEGYRLVVQRTPREDGQSDLFEGEHVYRCILTNDKEMSNKDVVIFYNQRGSTERCFDCMNNDFGWSHLPCSFMEKNTVFMGLMIFLHNFYRYFLGLLEGKGFGLTKTSRVKAFVYRFAAVPFKWVTIGTRRILRLFTPNRNYLQLQV